MILLVAALGALYCFSLFRIARLLLPLRTRVLLFGLRTALITLLAVAFLEPVFVVERIIAPGQPVPVLIDASKSMRLFAPDGAVARARSSLAQWNAGHADKRQKFVFYCFGDSLRPLNETVPLSWSDRRSFFPVPATERALRQASSVVLISDGNWSNAALPLDYFSDKNTFYLPLGTAERTPYLEARLTDFPATSPIDSPCTATLTMEGVARTADTIVANVVGKNRLIAQQTFKVPAGFFKKTAAFRIKNPAAGRHLYRFNTRMASDAALSYTCSALHSVLPSRFGYELYTARPTLDKRFMQITLQRHHDLTESGNETGRSPDLIVFFDWDDNARKAMERLSPRGAALFIGCLPCTDQTAVDGQASGALVRSPSQAAATPFDGLDFSKQPPASRYVFCKELSGRGRNDILSVRLPRGGTGIFDTLPVLFTGRYLRNNFIACAAADLWRWDFWPLAVESGEERAFGFSERLVLLTKEVLVNGLAGELLLYPETRLSEQDSALFRIAFPADLPVPCEVNMACAFSSANNRRYDTAFAMTVTGSLHQAVHFKPFAAGHYRLEAVATTNNRRYVFADSMAVDQDRSEYLVSGQNTALLQEFAQPVTDFSEASLRTLFFTTATEMKRPVKESLHFNRNWPLLLMAFFVFAAEWVVRRVKKLE
jgi:hypothetical protein